MRSARSLLLALLVVGACSDTTVFQPAEELADTELALAENVESEPEADVEPVLSASPVASFSPMLISSADQLLNDPFLEQLTNNLTIPRDGKKIQRAFERFAAALAKGDGKAQEDAFTGAKEAVAAYGHRAFDPDDDIHLDVIDRFLDAIEEMMLVEENINQSKGND